MNGELPARVSSTGSSDTHAATARAALSQARQRAAQRGVAVMDELMSLTQAQLTTGAGNDLLDSVASATGVDLIRSARQVDKVIELMAFATGDPPDNARVMLSDGREAILMTDPWNEKVVSALVAKLGRYVEPVAASSDLLTQLSSGGSTSPDARRLDASANSPRSSKSEPSSKAVAFVDHAIVRASTDGASDVHFECDRTGVGCKLRLDGVMTPLSRLEGVQQAEEVISRIKVMSKLDITERRLPQDGRFRFSSGASGLDLRVSIMPSVFGEDAVLRLLDKGKLQTESHQTSLDALGFEFSDARQIRLLAGLPSGMLLVTGPTGSGKTTTVYASLSEINSGQEKIITIEDPVEYELAGVLQIPVNEKKGLTFARGLRSILRHDPDRILVGEIRDAETAEIAIQAALTGHLVFTTVHANSLFDVIGRFRHFDIDMFGFVSALNGVVVQRLTRRLCTFCASRRRVTTDEAAWLASHHVTDLLDLPVATGCDRCHGTGYRGRFVIAEVHRILDSFRDRVVGQADVSELKRAAFDPSRRPLIETAIAKVRRGQTSLEEVYRVVGPV